MFCGCGKIYVGPGVKICTEWPDLCADCDAELKATKPPLGPSPVPWLNKLDAKDKEIARLKRRIAVLAEALEEFGI